MRTSIAAIALCLAVVAFSGFRAPPAEQTSAGTERSGRTAGHRFEDAADYGFLPAAAASHNVAALQRAVKGGKKTLTVSKPGQYLLDGRIYLDDDTTIIFGRGVVLKKTGDYDFVFINRGALTKTWNENITLDGLNLSVNQVESIPAAGQDLFGLRGQVSMFYIRNFTLSRFTCLDCGEAQFAVHVCRFSNLAIDTFEVRGRKDGVHIGRGEKFVIRNGICETFDDAIALNAEDYPSAQPEQGDIKDGIVENIYDVKKQATIGDFYRLLTGAWVDWHDGVALQNGDTVVHGANVYRVIAPRGTTEYRSHEPPVRSRGAWKDGAGLTFVYNQNDNTHRASITNVLLENIHCFTPAMLFSCNSQAQAVIDKINSTSCLASFQGNDLDCSLLVTAAFFRPFDKRPPYNDIQVGGTVNININLESILQTRDINLKVGGLSHTRLNGTASVSSVKNLSPAVGDSIKVNNVLRTYNGSNWE